MDARPADRAIEALARSQHGVFSRRQALLAGVSPSQIGRRVRSDVWLRLAPGVYALPGNPPTWRRQLKAAELSLAGAAICGRPACALRGLTGFKPGRAEIVVPPGASTRSPLAVVRRYHVDRVSTVDGIRVVTAAQALVDAAPTVSDGHLRRALDDMVVGDPVVLDEVRARYLAARRRRGLSRLARLLGELGDGYVPTESELETVLRSVAGLAALPQVEWQAPLPWAPGGRHRVDGLVPAWGVILEADGRRWHTRIADFDRDHDRDLVALRHGLVVARFTWAQLTGRPDECVEVLLDIGRARTLCTPTPVPSAHPVQLGTPRARGCTQSSGTSIRTPHAPLA
jgi:very-short-patch-repair endonuclease